MSNVRPLIGACIVAANCLQCSSAPMRGPSSEGLVDGATLGSYQGTMSSLFDDGIDAEVFAIPGQGVVGDVDRRIVERVKNSSLVVIVTVATVTDEIGSEKGRIELELSPAERPIRGSVAETASSGGVLRVKLQPSSAGYALVRANQTELVGKRMTLCLARFAEGNAAVEHWHAFADSPTTRASIAKAAAVADFD